MIVLSTFKFPFFFIEVQLIYNSIEILGVQRNYSQLLKVLNHKALSYYNNIMYSSISRAVHLCSLFILYIVVCTSSSPSLIFQIPHVSDIQYLLVSGILLSLNPASTSRVANGKTSFFCGRVVYTHTSLLIHLLMDTQVAFKSWLL